MNAEWKQSPDGTLVVKGTLDIYASEAFRDALMRQLQNPIDISIDLSEVTQCDLISVQLLFATRKSADRDGRAFRILGSPSCLTATCAEAGLPVDGLGDLQRK